MGFVIFPQHECEQILHDKQDMRLGICAFLEDDAEFGGRVDHAIAAEVSLHPVNN